MLKLFSWVFLFLLSVETFSQNYYQQYPNQYPANQNFYTTQNLIQDLFSMEKFAREVLMPRSKKDSKKHKISRRTRDHVKKIYAYAKWLQGNISGSLGQGANLRMIRDNYNQEQHFKALNKYTLYAIWDIRASGNADKLLDMLYTFHSRFVRPIGQGIGYTVYAPETGQINPYLDRYNKGDYDSDEPEFFIQIG